MSPVTEKNSASAINPVIFYMLCNILCLNSGLCSCFTDRFRSSASSVPHHASGMGSLPASDTFCYILLWN